MSWGSIAKAFEQGMATPDNKPKRKYIPTETTLSTGETKSITEWVEDTRNIHKLSYRCLHMRAERGINDIDKFFAPSRIAPPSLDAVGARRRWRQDRAF